MTESGDLNPSSPAGQIQSTAAFADGLTRLRGWRRQAARWLIVAVFALPLVVIVLVHVTR